MTSSSGMTPAGLVSDYTSGVDRDALAGSGRDQAKSSTSSSSETFPALFQTLGGLERGLAWTQKEEAGR